MKNDKRLWIATALFILATFVYIGIQYRRINRLADANQLQSIELSTLNDSVLVYQNKAGELTYKLSVVEVSHSNLKESLQKAGFDIQKLKDRDIAWRKVTAALRLQLAATGSGETTVVDTFRIETTDTIYYQKIADWNNNHLFLLNSKLERNILSFDYQYRTDLNFITEKRKKETIVSVTLTDPNASITTANSITVTHKKKIWERGWLWAVVGLGTGILIGK